MKRIFSIVFALAILALFVWTAVYLYHKSEQKPVVYKTEQPAIHNIIQKTVATGSIVPKKQIDLKSRVSGIVEELYVTPGEEVKTGQKIAKIKIIPNVVTLNNAESDLNKAQINFNESQIEFQRQKKLYHENVIAASEFTQDSTKFVLAKESLASAQNNLQLVKEGASKSTGQASNVIYSTADGMVLDIPVKKGSSVIESNNFNDGTTIATVANMNKLMFKGNVAESEVGKLKLGMNINIDIGAIEGKVYHTTLNYIAPQGTTVQGAIQFEIRADMPQSKSNFIRANYSANADIVLNQRDSVLTVPEGDVIFHKDSSFVEVETQPQVFVKKPIETGLSDGINIQVIKGVQLGDKIKKQENQIKSDWRNG